MKFKPGEQAEYYIRRDMSTVRRAEFTIAKFDGTKQPVATYLVVVTPEQVTCTCPGYIRPDTKRPCRHCEMVARWVLNGDRDV